jgi:hypothetical protein
VGLADRLGYHHDDPNAAQRWMRRYASSRFGAWTFAKTLHHVDRLGRGSGRVVRQPGTQTALVQNLHFFALARTISPHCGHSFIAGPAGAGLRRALLIM